jgi:hypothetical protein
MGKKKTEEGLSFDEIKKDLSELTEPREQIKFIVKMALGSLEVSPDEYQKFLVDYKPLIEGCKDFWVAKMEEMVGMNQDEELESKKELKGKKGKEKGKNGRTLIVKVQMVGVAKPPVWREFAIPSTFNFEQLHTAIQIVYSLGDYHLWSFGRHAYDRNFQIGLMDQDDWDNFTEDAQKTCVNKYLKEKGDQMVYVYDFGDDWNFTVKVQDVLDEECTHPYLTKWKGDLQPEEDCGGVYSYLEFRDYKENGKQWTQKKKKEFADEKCYESIEEIDDMIEDCTFDEDLIREQLNQDII